MNGSLDNKYVGKSKVNEIISAFPTSPLKQQTTRYMTVHRQTLQSNGDR